MFSNSLLSKQRAKRHEMLLREFQHLFAESSKPMLHYLVPESEWSTGWVGYYLTYWVKKLGITAYLSHKPPRVRGDILHYGETASLLNHFDSPVNELNWTVATVFYGNRLETYPEMAQDMERVVEHSQNLNRIVVSCSTMESRLIEWGVRENKVELIPLGVDLDVFFPASEGEKARLREKFEIPQEAFCVGSFQKDGEGWEEGDQPKLIKGPDVFLETCEQLKARIPNLFVLLTGPARGYVKQGLEKLNIPYQHIFVKNYHEIRDCFACLDTYCIPSREEGGPRAVLEALACGIPLVSTNVGMSADMIEHGISGLLSESEDPDELANSIEAVFDDHKLAGSLSAEGISVVKEYDWSAVAALYFEAVYAPLMMRRYS